jgi:hypothetical protein
MRALFIPILAPRDLADTDCMPLSWIISMAALIKAILLFLIVSADMEGLPIFTHSFIAELMKQAINKAGFALY